MSGLARIPKRISSLLNLHAHAPQLAVKKSQVESDKSHLLSYSPELPNIHPFLFSQLAFLSLQIEYLDSLQYAVRDLEQSEDIPTQEWRETRDDIDLAKLNLRGEILALKKGRDIIIEDMSDELKTSPSPDLREAYSMSMMHRTNIVDKKKKKPRFRNSNFKDVVLEFYDGSRETKSGKKELFCNLTGWLPNSSVRIAHIVPKFLDQASLAHLFGGGLETPKDPRNALILHADLEVALDNGDIVFVPEPGGETWKCVVTMSSEMDSLAFPRYTWEDIDGLPLTFNNNRTPRKRYLFFRYLITYLTHKQDDNLDWARRIESQFEAWTSPGEYLGTSTLRTLLESATGEELPETMFRMFGCINGPGEERPSCPEEDVSQDELRCALDSAVQSTRLGGSGDESEGSESEEESEECEKESGK